MGPNGAADRMSASAFQDLQDFITMSLQMEVAMHDHFSMKCSRNMSENDLGLAWTISIGNPQGTCLEMTLSWSVTYLKEILKEN